MKLRNKKTGGIGKLSVYTDGHVSVDDVVSPWSENTIKSYNSLAELNEEWEDYEEDELLYVISAEHKSGYQCVLKEEYPEICEVAKELGIGFETEKECRKAVEKLKAWKRLEDKGFEFDYWEYEFSMVDKPAQTIVIKANAVDTNNKDLDLLFWR